MAAELSAISQVACAQFVALGSSMSLSMFLALLWFYPLPSAFSFLLFLSCFLFLSPLDSAALFTIPAGASLSCLSGDFFAGVYRGAVLGIGLAGPALAIRLAADYATRVIFPARRELEAQRFSYQLAYLLLAVMVLIDFLPAVLGILQAQALNGHGIFKPEYLAKTLSGAFRMGLLISTPLFVLAITLGLINVILERISPDLLNSRFASSLLLPMLLLFGSQSIYALGRESVQLGLRLAVGNSVAEGAVSTQASPAEVGGDKHE